MGKTRPPPPPPHSHKSRGNRINSGHQNRNERRTTAMMRMNGMVEGLEGGIHYSVRLSSGVRARHTEWHERCRKESNKLPNFRNRPTDCLIRIQWHTGSNRSSSRSNSGSRLNRTEVDVRDSPKMGVFKVIITKLLSMNAATMTMAEESLFSAERSILCLQLWWLTKPKYFG